MRKALLVLTLALAGAGLSGCYHHGPNRWGDHGGYHDHDHGHGDDGYHH